jgi:hypothetical protein
MTTIGTSLQQGMSVLAKLIGEPTFLWKGAAVDCIPANVQDANSVVAGGFQDDVQMRLLVKIQDWLSADSAIVLVDDTVAVLGDDERPKPIIGRTLTYKGRLYRITQVRQDPSGGFYQINLASPRK